MRQFFNECRRLNAMKTIAGAVVFALGLGTLANGDVIPQKNRETIERLISQLVSPNSDPNPDGRDILGFPKDYDKTAQILIRETEKKLTELGKDAFPILIAQMTDERYSQTISTSLERSFSVGEICYLIVERQVDVAGLRYKTRKDLKGDHHISPSFFRQYWQAEIDKEVRRQQSTRQ